MNQHRVPNKAFRSALSLSALVVTISCASSPTRQPAVQTPPESQRARANLVVPSLEILGMDTLLNVVGRQGSEAASFQVTPASIGRNLRGGWVVEHDPFQINQFLHPYQGAMYHNIARSAGFGYWQSAAFTLAGSTMWEIAGETTPPSWNDQIASGIAGSFLGEPLFRTARMLMHRRRGDPGPWSVLTSTAVSPPVGVNRMLFGDRYDPPTPEILDAADIRFDVGVEAPLLPHGSVEWSRPFIGVLVDYGVPGTPGYAHARPFDYFRIDGTVSSDGLDNLSTRGLIAGKDYQGGDTVRGIWGVYGTYDYFAPDVFRISSTALAFGTTVQSSLWSMSSGLMLHNTALAGVGYTAVQRAGTDGSDYHYGIAPQALLNTRVIAGRRAALDLTAREYFISDVGGFGTRPRDLVFRGDASVAVRIFGRHALAVKFVLSRRDATHPELPPVTQTRSSVGLFYSFLGAGGFGTIR